MTNKDAGKVLISLILITIVSFPFFFLNPSLNAGRFLLVIFVTLVLFFSALVNGKFLIFETALFLMLTATQFVVVNNIMEAIRWIPYIIFAFIFGSILMKNKNLPREIEWFDKIMFIIIIIMFLSVFYSIDPLMTIKRSGTFLLLYVSVFWVIYPKIQSKGDIEKVIDLILYAAFVPYMFSIIVLFFPDIGFWGNRFRGYFINPNTVGVLSAILLPLVFWKTLDRNSRWIKVLLFLILFLLLISGSRSGILGSIIGGGYYIFVTKKEWRIPTLFLSILSLILIYTIGKDVLTSLSSYLRINLQSGSGDFTSWEAISSGRGEQWRIMGALFKKKPFSGYGFGTEDLLFRKLEVEFKGRGFYAHNSFLGIAVQVGFFGALLLFFPIFYLIFSTVERESNISAALKGVLIGGLVSSFFESWFYSVGSAFAFPFWICVALLLKIKLHPELFERKEEGIYVKMDRFF